MESKYDYNDLERHFKEPKILSSFYNFKRLPRKLKKRIKGYFWISQTDKDINVILWYLLEFNNPDYKRFLIKKICEKYI